MPVTFKLGPIFDKQKLKRELSKVPLLAAEEFAEYVPKQQIKGPQTGVVRKIRGKVHRASRRGERPAVLSGKQTRSTRAKKTGQFSAEVTTQAKNKGFDYSAHLEGKMGRPIQDAPEDIKTAQKMLDKQAEKALARLK